MGGEGEGGGVGPREGQLGCLWSCGWIHGGQGHRLIIKTSQNHIKYAQNPSNPSSDWSEMRLVAGDWSRAARRGYVGRGRASVDLGEGVVRWACGLALPHHPHSDLLIFPFVGALLTPNPSCIVSRYQILTRCRPRAAPALPGWILVTAPIFRNKIFRLRVLSATQSKRNISKISTQVRISTQNHKISN